MMKAITEFPPVTYSSSFVNYIITQTTNEKDSCDENMPSICQDTSRTIKLKWQQLARDAFNYSLNQKIKLKASSPLPPQQQQKANSNNNNNNNSNHPMKNQQVQTYLFKHPNLIDLIALNTNVNTTKILNCNRFDSWIQLSGHEDSFALAGPGTIWKKHSPDSTEIDVYEALINEPIAEMLPKFYRNVQYKGDNFIELEDLLYHFKDAAIMDIKMGTRTFLESEVSNKQARHDLYEKMLRIGPKELTEQEIRDKAVTKLRYMKFREDLSSSSNLGFRIEGFKVGKNVKHNKNLHLIKQKEEVEQVLETFFRGRKNVCHSILNRLKLLRQYFETSPFFQKHEIIGSSLLIIYTTDKAGVWMIDFAKTLPIPDNIQINHRNKWIPGNHEDGYLFGLDNLISIITNFVK